MLSRRSPEAQNSFRRWKDLFSNLHMIDATKTRSTLKFVTMKAPSVPVHMEATPERWTSLDMAVTSDFENLHRY